ncbi:MAG TPA: hypothetical protein VF178_16455 [Gemmatimonadaceae bacterium]
MHIEVVDALRCIEPHEETWLVASVEAWHGRQIRTGTLGCPVCRASYPVVNGVADFTGAATTAVDGSAAGGAPDVDDALRLAALLDLREAGGIVLLAGRHAALVDALEAMTAAHYVVLLAPNEAWSGPGSALRVRERLPFASASVRAAAVDGGLAGADLLGQMARVIRPAGRLVAPVGTPVPDEISELARDDRDWVGERQAATTPPVALRRRAT